MTTSLIGRPLTTRFTAWLRRFLIASTLAQLARFSNRDQQLMVSALGDVISQVDLLDQRDRPRCVRPVELPRGGSTARLEDVCAFSQTVQELPGGTQRMSFCTKSRMPSRTETLRINPSATGEGETGSGGGYSDRGPYAAATSTFSFRPASFTNS